LGRYEEAVASYDQALKFKPDKDSAWYNRGNALGNLGRYEEAVASFDQALKIKPDDDSAWNNRGNALGNLGRYEEAVASFDQALKLNQTTIRLGTTGGMRWEFGTLRRSCSIFRPSTEN
jgi:tetratricopeptide (TPR) repeat protein